MSAASFGLQTAAACCHEHNNSKTTASAATTALYLARRRQRHRASSKNGLERALVCSCLAAVACYCLATISSSNRSSASCRHQQAASDGCTGGGAPLWPFTGVDAYPARAYDACNMNDFRDIENMACISGCLHSTSGGSSGGGSGAVSEQSGLLDHSRSKRAIYNKVLSSSEEGVIASTTTASVQQHQHQHQHRDGTDGKARHEAEIFDEANQHMWRMLLDEIKRTRLSLAESESQERQADAVPNTLAQEKADADDMSTTTTTVSSVSGILRHHHHHDTHHHRQLPQKEDESAVELTKSLLLLRMRRGNDASDCNRCMLEVVNRYNSCTLRQQGGGRAGGSKRT